MNLKQFIFNRMQENGYCLDIELAKFCNDNGWNEERDIPFRQAEIYKTQYRSLENQKSQFDEKENKVISSYKNSHKNAKTKYSLRYKGMEEGTGYKITKAYFEYLKDNGLARVVDRI